MAIRNQETGKYEHEIFIKATGKLIVGYGSTKEEALADAKTQKNVYLANPLEESVEKTKSPGNFFHKDKQGNWIPEYSANREIPVKARKELLDIIAEKVNKNK